MSDKTMQTGREVQKRRRFGDSKHSNSKGKKRAMKPSNNFEVDKRKKMDPRMKKMLKRKARDYNSDTDDSGNDNVEKLFGKSDGRKFEVPEGQEFVKSSSRKYEVPEEQEFEKSGGRMYEDQEDHEEHEFEKSGGKKYGKNDDVFDEEEEDEEDGEEGEDNDGGDVSDDENGKLQPGIMRFTDGCKVFQGAFRKIIKRTASDHSEDVLGPVLSGNKRLVAEKLAENDPPDMKEKKEAKKEKLLISEKGHVKPDTYLDTHEKLLMSIATKGVVKLFNAVSKAQQSQKGLNPLRAKDQKALKNRRKDAFFSELGKKSLLVARTSKVGASTGEPAWAPLRDDFMLNKSKLKDWDKNQDTKDDDSDSPGSSSGEE